MSGTLYLKWWKGEILQPRILHSARLSFRFDRESKSFTDKPKLRECSTTRPVSQQILKVGLFFPTEGWKTSLGGKEKATTRNRQKNYKWESSPRKANIKIGNHPHTNMISKPAIMKRGEYTNAGNWKCIWNLRDQQLKTILYIKTSWEPNLQ